MRADNEVFEDSFIRAAGVIMGKKLSAAMNDQRQAATDAIGEILKCYHIKPREVPESMTDMNETLEFLLRPHGIMRRNVVLEKGWYKDASGPMIGTLKEDGFFYVTYVNEFVNEETRALNYDTCIARSMDLVTWEEGTRPILFPDYNHRPFPRKHPAVFEINASDAEFIEKDGKVNVFYCGGNQQGVCDNATAEFNGSLLDLFHKFFIS